MRWIFCPLQEPGGFCERAAYINPVKLTRLLLLYLFLGTALATTYPLTVTDDLGEEVTLQTEPMRIVSMLPSHTETLCALDACDKLVGCGPLQRFPGAGARLARFGRRA